MNRLFPVFLLLIYVAALARPLYPLLDYTLHKEYIAKVLCENKNKPAMHCNGKCHLMKQLKKASEDLPRNHAPAVSFENLLPHFSTGTILFQAKIQETACLIHAPYLSSASTSHLSLVFQPPQS